MMVSLSEQSSTKTIIIITKKSSLDLKEKRSLVLNYAFAEQRSRRPIGPLERAKPAAAYLLRPDLDAASNVTVKSQGRGGWGEVEDGENKIITKKKAAFFFWQTRIPNDPLWFICDGSNTMQAACFSPWDHEQLLAHNYVVIHCYLEEKTRADS